MYTYHALYYSMIFEGLLWARKRRSATLHATKITETYHAICIIFQYQKVNYNILFNLDYFEYDKIIIITVTRLIKSKL